MLPKIFGLKHPEVLSALNAKLLLKFSNFIASMRDLIVWAPEKLLRMLGRSHDHKQSVSEDLFRAMVDTSAQEGVLDTQEQSIIHNVLKLDDIMVNKIMTSRETVSFFYQDMLLSDVLQHLQVNAYSRFPVLDQDKRQVTGVLYAKDLLTQENLSTQIVANLMRKPLFIQPSANALELFTLFKLNKMHFAVVAIPGQEDFLGVVTLENVLEKIFGDFKDERDLEDEDEA